MGGADEIFEFADDFGKAAGEIGKALFDTFKQEGEAYAEDWRANAKQHFDGHAKHYPKSITSESKLAFGIHIETGPENGKKQGFLGPILELGGEHSPAYLDGLRALDPATERLEKAADATIGFLLP